MRIKTWAIGVFIIVGFGLFTAILFQIGSRQKAFSRHLEVYTEFSNLGGLASGAKVRVSGFDAGQIKKIEIPRSPSGKFRLELEVEEKVHGMIRKDSLASIETEGVVGDKFVSVKKGTDQAEEVRSGETLPSKEPIDIAALMEKGSTLLNDVHGSVTDIRGRADIALDSITKTVNHADTMIDQVRPNINEVARSSVQITDKIDALMTDLNAGKGPAGMLLKDEATKQQIQTTLSNIQQASANINQVADRANQTIADVQSRQLVARMQVSLDHVQSLSEQLDVSVKQALAQDTIGQDGGTNMRETLSNLNRSTANLADDTDALKHNFFFRGFFKKRGFYDLDQLSRAEYQKACDRQKNGGTRRWLDAATLLSGDAHGEEQLSESGRRLIDNQVAPVVESLPSHVIVIEGYARDGSPDEQFIRSKKRADLVRHYLEAHYHLRHNKLGIVALSNQPPPNADRNAWDGAAIMVLQEQR